MISLWKVIKEIYTRGTLRSIRISRLAKTPILIGWYPCIKKRANYFSCIERGVWKTCTLLHKMPRYLFIYYKIYFEVIKQNNWPWSIKKHLLFCKRFSQLYLIVHSELSQIFISLVLISKNDHLLQQQKKICQRNHECAICKLFKLSKLISGHF